MPFETYVKAWGGILAGAKANAGTNKEYMAQVNTVGGLFARANTRVDQADATLAKLIAGYKVLVTELKTLEAGIKEAMKDGEAANDGLTADLMKGGCLAPVTKYRELVEKNLASLQKEKRKME